MRFIRPTAITQAMLTASNVPETDYAEWVSGTTYALGARVIRASQHKIYQRAVAGAGTTPPETDTANWVEIGATNRWAMFDGKVGTVTSQATSISVTLTPGRINSLALLNVDASTVDVALVVAGDTVYSASIDLDSGAKVGNWYDYFYEPIYQQDTVIITDLVDAALLDIPSYGDGVLTVTLSRTAGTVSCGLMVVGMVYEIGDTAMGASVSIRDYSRKEADEFGNYTIVQRSYSKKISAQIIVPRERSDEVVRNVSRYRATNMVWIGSDTYGSLIVYGFAADWRLSFSNSVICEFSLEIEGMT